METLTLTLFPGCHCSSEFCFFFLFFIPSHASEHTYCALRAALILCRLAVSPLQVNSFKVNYRLPTMNVRGLAVTAAYNFG